MKEVNNWIELARNLPLFKYSKLTSYTLEVALIVILNPYVHIQIVSLQQSIGSMHRCGTSHVFSKFGQKLVLMPPAQVLGTPLWKQQLSL